MLLVGSYCLATLFRAPVEAGRGRFATSPSTVPWPLQEVDDEFEGRQPATVFVKD